jgi:hypothetical protein
MLALPLMKKERNSPQKQDPLDSYQAEVSKRSSEIVLINSSTGWSN